MNLNELNPLFTIKVSQITNGLSLKILSELRKVAGTIISAGEFFSQHFETHEGDFLLITDGLLPENKNNIFVYIDGVLTNDFVFTENSITLATPLTNQNVFVKWYGSLESFTDRPPSPNTNLSVGLTGTKSVQLSWNSGGGFGTDGKPDRYILYYSQTPLTQSNFRNFAFKVITFEVSGSFNDTMSAVVSGFEPNIPYYFAITSEKVDGSITRESLISNVVFGRTKSEFVPVPNSTLLPVLPYNIIDWHRRYNRDPETNTFIDKATAAFDGDIVLDSLGEPSSDSKTNAQFRSSSTGYRTWTNYRPLRLVADLGEMCRVDKVYLHFGGLAQDLSINVSVDGWNWTEVAFVETVPFGDRNKFLRYDVPMNSREARYVMLLHNPMSLNEMVIMGSRLSDNLPSGTKLLSETPQRPIYEAFASNVFLNDVIPDWMKFGATHRIYSNWSWYLPNGNSASAGINVITNPNVRLTPEDAAETLNGQPIMYLFEGNRIHGNTDNHLALVKQLQNEYYGITECETFLGVKSLPPFLRLPLDGFDPADPNLNFEPPSSSSWKAQDTAMYPDFSDTTDPMTYRFAAQCCFVFCARYGRTTGHPEHLLRLHPNETPKQGLDLVKYFQFWNEPNLTWEGERGYTNPFEFAAWMSACYDGHKGALGEGMGVKAADPTMKFVMPGLTGLYPDYIRGAMLWWDYHRGVGDYPIDVLSFHYYHNTVGGQGISEGRAGLTPDMPSPNGEFFDNMLPISRELRDRWFAGKEWWLSETGYDEGEKSLQAARIGDSVDNYPRPIGTLKGEWILKSMFHALGAGCQKIDHYMYRNGAPLKELNANNFTNTYQSSGYVDLTPMGAGQGWRPNPMQYYPKLDSYFIIKASMNALHNLKMSHRVSFREIEDVPDIIIKDPLEPLHDKIIAYGFDDAKSSGATSCLSLWLATTDDSETTVKINVGSQDEVEVISIREAANLQSEVGISTFYNSVLENGIKTIEIPLTETPIFVKTNNIGKSSLITPFLKGIASSNSSIRLFWEDFNPDMVDVRVFQYNNTTEEYDLIFEGDTPNSRYDVVGLADETEYQFVIQLKDPLSTRESLFSNTLRLRTNPVIVPPQNFRQSNISFDRVTLAWDYDEVNQNNISGFRIERSLEPTSGYQLIASVGANQRQFTNIGLNEQTTYYYKIQAFSTFGTSIKSGAVAVTTSEALLTPPQIDRAATDYFGNFIYIGFDVPVTQTANSASAFTVFDGTNLIQVSNTSIDQSGARLRLHLDSKPDENGSIVVGYDGQGFINSTLGVPAAVFSNYSVVNNINAESLIGNRIGVNLTTQDFTTPPNANSGEFWNDIIPTSTSQSFYLEAAVDLDTNSETDYGFMIPFFSTTQRRNIIGAINSQTRDFSNTDNSVFPEFVKKTTMNFNATAPTTARMVFAFLNLKFDRIYKIEVFGSRATDSVERNVKFILNEGLDSEQILNTGNNGEDFLTFNNIIASNPDFLFADDTSVVPLAQFPKAVITCNLGTPRENSGINGLILTEINDINFNE